MNDPMMKLYEKLTDEERGKLAFTYLLKGDTTERERIESTMTREYFIAFPDGYRRAFININNLRMVYAVAYWRQVAQCQAYLSGTMALIHEDLKHPDEAATYPPMLARFEAAEAALMAIDEAFNDVCDEHGLDAELLQIGGRFYTIATSDTKPDEDCLAGYREIFADAMA